MFDAVGLGQQGHRARELHDALVAVAPRALLHDGFLKDAFVRQPGGDWMLIFLGWNDGVDFMVNRWFMTS
jgi:hypothetical protein